MLHGGKVTQRTAPEDRPSIVSVVLYQHPAQVRAGLASTLVLGCVLVFPDYAHLGYGIWITILDHDLVPLLVLRSTGFNPP